MKKCLFVLMLIAFIPSVVFAGNTISWHDASNHYGKYKTVEGTVVSAKCLPKVCFLNFDRDYRNTFSVVIFASDFHKFHGQIDRFYKNKSIRVSGVIKEYKGKPQIIVNDPEQIQLSGAGR